MTEAQQQQQISPERQMMAAQVGAVFNSMHEYLRTLEPTINGNVGPTKQLEFAHCRIDEAAMWAIKSVLSFGTTPQQPANDATPDAPAAPATDSTAATPAPIGVVDPVQPDPSSDVAPSPSND